MNILVCPLKVDWCVYRLVSRIHRLEKRPIGGSSAAEHDEKRLRAEFDETESKFLSLQVHDGGL